MSTYKDEEYWELVQEQERAEEEARYIAKMELEDKLNEKPKKVWTEDQIRWYVQNNDQALYGALKKLYACQTADEQRSGETKEHNGVGFNGVDAEFLSSVSEFLIKTGFLTYKQKAITRKKLVKYTKQLTRLANE